MSMKVTATFDFSRVYDICSANKAIDNYIRRHEDGAPMIGELNHNDPMRISLENVSHKITKLGNDNGIISIEAEILDTPDGKIVQNILNSHDNCCVCFEPKYIYHNEDVLDENGVPTGVAVTVIDDIISFDIVNITDSKKLHMFEYTEDNYIDYVPKEHNNFSIYMRGDDSFSNFLNGVNPSFMTSRCIDDEGKPKDPFKGKTIDFYYLSEDNDFWFMGFTDGTFVLRERTDHSIIWSSHHHEPQMYWSDAYSLNPDICVTNNLSYIQTGNTGNKDFRPKITCIGRWIEEHTDADIIGYYNAVVAEQERRDKISEEFQHKRDLEEYNRLKEKLGL